MIGASGVSPRSDPIPLELDEVEAQDGSAENGIDGEQNLLSDEVSQIAQLVSDMEALSPKYIRSIAVHHAMRRCGKALRTPPGRGTSENFYEYSVVTDSFDEFWSHSWQGRASHKILTLLLLKNGIPAALLGTIAAMIGFWLSYFKIIPSFGLPLWNSIYGLAVYLPTLFLWRNAESVFLDAGCIHQTDETLKSEAWLE